MRQGRARGTTRAAARVAKPGPRALNAALVASKAGVARSVGSQRWRHAGRRLKVKASTDGVRRNAAAVTPDSILCAEECHDVLSQPASMPWQSSRNNPSAQCPPPQRQPTTPTRENTRPRAAHNPSAKPTTRMPGGSRRPGCKPRTRGCERPEVTDVVMYDAESRRLSHVGEKTPATKIAGAASPQIAADGH